MILNKKTLFTLVELVIAIVMIAILLSIATISITKWINSSRDSKRNLDLGQIQASLESYKFKEGLFPKPEGFITTWMISGTIVTLQWNIQDWLAKLLRFEVAPRDPTSDDYYVYSITADGQRYQLAAALESDETLSLLSKVYAATPVAKVVGKYDWYAVFVTGSNTLFATIPSLVLVTDWVSMTADLYSAASYFVVNGKENLPYKYKGQSGKKISTTALWSMQWAVYTAYNITTVLNGGTSLANVITGTVLIQLWGEYALQIIEQNLHRMIR